MPKKNNKTVLPDPLPNGEVLTDLAKKKWCLGPSIGVGGFGEIYSACDYTEGGKKSSYQYVVKIEPHGNGPLFCEMHFFMRNAKPDMIQSWCSEKKLSVLGMPRYLGSGSHEHKGKKYRFLVMDKYGKDLWHVFLENNRKFPVATVYKIGLQILDTLEYIHNNGYVHADIKGANILLGATKQTQNQVYLVDFGLATHYTKKDFKPDPKKAHNGTIEYTSRDAHDGVPTRRGDLEILAYNMVQWMGCKLPWENKSPETEVQNSKKKYMDDINLFLSTCFGNNKIPAGLTEFLDYVRKLKYDTEPDYKKIRSIFTNGIKSAGGTITGPLDFKSGGTKHKSEDTDDSQTPEKRARMSPAKKNTKAKAVNAETSDKPKRKGRPKKIVVEENSSDNENEPMEIVKKPRGRGKKVVENSSDTEYEPVVVKKPRGRGKKIKQTNENSSDNESEVVEMKKPKGRAKIVVNEEPASETNGYTAEMLKLQQKILARKATTKKGKAQTNSVSSSSGADSKVNTPPVFNDDDIIDATPPDRTPMRKRNKNTPKMNGEASDIELTPRTLRQRR